MNDRQLLEEVRRRLNGHAATPPTGPTFRQIWERHYREEARHLGTAKDIERVGNWL